MEDPRSELLLMQIKNGLDYLIRKQLASEEPDLDREQRRIRVKKILDGFTDPQDWQPRR